jgi:hypothetical protein
MQRRAPPACGGLLYDRGMVGVSPEVVCDAEPRAMLEDSWVHQHEVAE